VVLQAKQAGLRVLPLRSPSRKCGNTGEAPPTTIEIGRQASMREMELQCRESDGNTATRGSQYASGPIPKVPNQAAPRMGKSVLGDQVNRCRRSPAAPTNNPPSTTTRIHRYGSISRWGAGFSHDVKSPCGSQCAGLSLRSKPPDHTCSLRRYIKRGGSRAILRHINSPEGFSVLFGS